MKRLNPKPKKYHYQTKALARIEGHTTQKLLWQKILAEATPALREMLFAHLHLESAVHRIVPEDFDLLNMIHIEHFDLLDRIHSAEGLLTGMTPEVHHEVFQPRIAQSIEKLNIG